VDVKTDGGYVLMPPSRTADGKYTWPGDWELAVPPDRLPEPPSWLIEELDRIEANRGKAKAKGDDGQQAAAGAEPGEIPDGIRNDSLFKIGCNLRRHGLIESQIADALLLINASVCQPPLEEKEVRSIAKSAAKYEPTPGAADELPVTQSLRELIEQCPNLRPPVIHGLLRAGESMNVIAPPKLGKSWLVTDLALAVATGRPWLGLYPTEQGNVLIVDNELHRETLAHRIPKVMEARAVTLAECADRIDVVSLRGRLKDIFGLGACFSRIEPGRYKLVVLDAFYRVLPRDTDENDNGTMAQVYNVLDSYAAKLQCSFVLVHHSSKGNQGGKAVTDVGAGAGAQARAVDTHLILRQHEVPGVVVVDAAVRSWPPIQPRCLRWQYPTWIIDDTLDPAALRIERPRRKAKSEPEPGPAKVEWEPEQFVAAFVSEKPTPRLVIERNAAKVIGSKREVDELLRLAELQGLVYRWKLGASQPAHFANRPQPPETVK
jgi:hypothetical protein